MLDYFSPFKLIVSNSLVTRQNCPSSISNYRKPDFVKLS
jgi:hypothetical protein